MPIARWGISARDVDDFDRESQRSNYQGPTPPNGMYHWLVKNLKYAAKTKEKFPQIRVGLELYPREGEGFEHEERYEGFWIMAFLSVSPKTDWRYVPFLDAIGVTGAEFESRTRFDENQNITRIGSWKMDGQTIIAAELKDGEDQNGNPRKEIGQIAEAVAYDDEGEDYDEEEYAEEDD